MNTEEMLTILLVLKDRTPFTIRWMNYAHKISFPYRIMIADGGKDKKVQAIFSKPGHFPNVSYQYIRYPYDQSYSDYYKKVADALSRVETQFVTVADNASFYVFNGLRRSAEFLYLHPDYSVCGGRVGYFKIGPFDKFSEHIRIYGKEVQFFSKLYNLRNITDETATKRVCNHFQHYAPTYYDVHRTEELRFYFEALTDVNIKDIFLAELFTSFLTVCAGKIRKLDYLYMLRQMGHRTSAAGAHIKKNGDHFDRMLLESWSDDFSKFVYAVASEVGKRDEVPKIDAQQQIRNGYRMHIAPHIVRALSTQEKKAKRYMLEWLKGQIRKLKYDGTPRKFIEILYSVMSIRKNDPFNYIRPIPICRSSVFHKDIEPIRDILTSPVSHRCSDQS